MRVLARVIESISPRLVRVVAPSPIPLGEYLSLRYQINGREVKAIAVVANAQSRHAVQPSAIKYMDPEKSGEVSPLALSEMLIYVIAEKVGRGEPRAPRYPVPPDTPVTQATPEELRELYSPQREGKRARLGKLEIGAEGDAGSDRGIEINIDPNKLTKHLFIAGATGSGKSNTVAVLIDELSKMGAPVIVFDVHGEYGSLVMEGNRVPREGRALINPQLVSPRMLAGIIISEPAATRQRRLLASSVTSLHEELRELQTDKKYTWEEALKHILWEALESREEALKELLESPAEGKGSKKLKKKKEAAIRKALKEIVAMKTRLEGGQVKEEEMYSRSLLFRIEDIAAAKRAFDANTVSSAEDKVEEFFESSPVSLTAPSLLEKRAPGTVLVIDVSPYSDEQKRWILKLLVDELLIKLKKSHEQKKGDSAVLVVEEAPLFLGDKVSHPVKDSLQRFAREGRKFGGCLVIVSQRPRSLDVNVVSQLQNFIFLKVVQEEDVRTIMNVADNLEESLASMIKSFPEGKALVLGEFVGKFPVVVQIRRHEGKRAGATPELVKQWERELGERASHYED